MAIIVIFMLVGAIDRIRGNKLGYGEEFENGFMTIPFGALCGGLVMVFMGYGLSFVALLINLVPVIILAVLLIAGFSVSRLAWQRT